MTWVIWVVFGSRTVTFVAGDRGLVGVQLRASGADRPDFTSCGVHFDSQET